MKAKVELSDGSCSLDSVEITHPCEADFLDSCFPDCNLCESDAIWIIEKDDLFWDEAIERLSEKYLQ